MLRTSMLPACVWTGRGPRDVALGLEGWVRDGRRGWGLSAAAVGDEELQVKLVLGGVGTEIAVHRRTKVVWGSDPPILHDRAWRFEPARFCRRKFPLPRLSP